MKSINRKIRKKLNNKGMTLIEILVAMLILSLVSITFLEAMSFSLKLNMLAKEKQHALSFAQTLMEGTKAFDRDTLDIQFDSTRVTNSDFRVFRLANSDGSQRNVTIISTEPTKRTYELDNVNFNGEMYDATIITTPVSGSEEILVTIEDTNKYNDGYFKQRKNENVLLLEDVQNYLNSLPDEEKDEYVNTDSAYVNGILLSCLEVTSRDVVVTIESNDAVSVEVTYTYNIDNHPVEDAGGNPKMMDDGMGGETQRFVSATNETAVINYPEPSPDNTDEDDFEAAKVIFNKNGDPFDASVQATGIYGAKLERLYLYYYPAYKEEFDNPINNIPSCPSDNITIVNNSYNLKEVYIIKQRNPALNSGEVAVFENAESYYVANVSVTSTPGALDVYHNLGTLLAGNGTNSYNLSGDINNKGEPWKNDDDATALVYNVEIEITKHGSTDVLCHLDGTTNAK